MDHGHHEWLLPSGRSPRRGDFYRSCHSLRWRGVGIARPAAPTSAGVGNCPRAIVLDRSRIRRNVHRARYRPRFWATAYSAGGLFLATLLSREDTVNSPRQRGTATGCASATAATTSASAAPRQGMSLLFSSLGPPPTLPTHTSRI